MVKICGIEATEKSINTDALALAIIGAVRGSSAADSGAAGATAADGKESAANRHKHNWNVVWAGDGDEIAHCTCGRTRFRKGEKLFYRNGGRA